MFFCSDFSLKNYNTFGFGAIAKKFVEISSEQELQSILSCNDLPIQILGGGSNVLLTKGYYDNLFIHNNIKGIFIVGTNKFNEVTVEIGGGENWHQFVLWAIENNLGGVENLSLIPGTVGAAPIQNIGAYGTELQDVFEKLEGIHLKTRQKMILSKSDCRFGYRDSVFKNELKGEFVITKVFLNLTPVSFHAVNLEYGDLKQVLLAETKLHPTIKDVSDAVVKIRNTKLPDPKLLGNAGSFFKNPEINITEFEKLKLIFPNIVGFPTTKEIIKIPASWLIEHAGWKAKRLGNVGVYEKHSLVLVNYGSNSSSELIELSQKIQFSVLEKFGVWLHPEVNFL